MTAVAPLNLREDALPEFAQEALGEATPKTGTPVQSRSGSRVNLRSRRASRLSMQRLSIIESLHSAQLIRRQLEIAQSAKSKKSSNRSSRPGSAREILQSRKDQERDYKCQLHVAITLSVIGVGLFLAGLGMASYGIPTEERLKREFGHLNTTEQIIEKGEVTYFLFARIGGLFMGTGLFFLIIMLSIGFDYKQYLERQKPKDQNAELEQKRFYANIMKELNMKAREDDEDSLSSRSRSDRANSITSPMPSSRSTRPSTASALIPQHHRPNRRNSLPVKDFKPNHLSPKWSNNGQTNNSFDFSDEAVTNLNVTDDKVVQLKSLDDIFQVKSPRLLGEYSFGIDKINEEDHEHLEKEKEKEKVEVKNEIISDENKEKTQVDKHVEEILQISDKEDDTTTKSRPGTTAKAEPEPVTTPSTTRSQPEKARPITAAVKRPMTASARKQSEPVLNQAKKDQTNKPAAATQPNRPTTSKPTTTRPTTSKPPLNRAATAKKLPAASKPANPERVKTAKPTKSRVQTAQSQESTADSENTTDTNDKVVLIDNESRPYSGMARDYTMVFDSDTSSEEVIEDDDSSENQEKLNNLNQSGHKMMKDKLLTREDTLDDNIIDEMTKEIYRNLDVDPSSGTPAASSSNFNVQVHVHVHVNSSPNRQSPGKEKKVEQLEKTFLPFEGDGAI